MLQHKISKDRAVATQEISCVATQEISGVAAQGVFCVAQGMQLTEASAEKALLVVLTERREGD